MEFLIKSSALIVIFYLFYQYILSKETFYNFNRVFLLLGIILSVVIPFIIIPIYTTYSFNPITTSGVLKTMNNLKGNILTDTVHVSSFTLYSQIFGMIFFWGTFIMGIRFIISLLTLNSTIQNQYKIQENDFNLIESNNDISPFSFFNNIVYNPSKYTGEELEHILQHEKTHVKQWHTIDIILANLLNIFFWFNPFVYLYKKAIEQNLEFIADSNVKQPETSNNYEFLLLKSVVPAFQLQLVNNFFTSPIKKRISMINTEPSNPIKRWKYLLIIPILSIFLYSFNTKEVYKLTVETTSKDKVTFIPPLKNQDKISSKFGEKIHPVLKVKKFHRGIDYNVKNNTEVVASEKGLIKLVGINKGNGNYISITHNDGFETRYSHLSKFTVIKNQKVFQGQKIGYSGNSGSSSGSNLHFEVILDGKYIDPETVFPQKNNTSSSIKKYIKTKVFNINREDEIKIITVEMDKNNKFPEILKKNNLSQFENDNVDIINLSDSTNLKIIFKKGADEEPDILINIINE